MEQRTKAVENFINEMAQIPVPSANPTPIEGLKYAMCLMALADKLFDTGYRAGLTEKTINDLEK